MCSMESLCTLVDPTTVEACLYSYAYLNELISEVNRSINTAVKINDRLCGREAKMLSLILVSEVFSFLACGKVSIYVSRANNHPGPGSSSRTWRMRLISKLSVLKLGEANQ